MPVKTPRSQTRRAGSSQRANSRQRLAETARQAQALTLRLTGASYEQIAQVLHYYDRAGAWKAVEKALERTIQEPADKVRAIELARLDRWLLAINAQIATGSLDAVDRGLKIMARRAALLGLDAPAKVAPTTPDGTQPYDAAMRQKDVMALAALLGLAPQQLPTTEKAG